ncbi:MAG: hypothetical protein ACLUFN_09150 [Eubacterium sp.]
MTEKMKNKIIEEVLMHFRNSREYTELKKLYTDLKSSIKDDLILSKISELESLLDKKTKIEIIYSYNKAVKKSEENNAELSFSDIDSSIELNKLYDDNSYYELENTLKSLRNSIRNNVKNAFSEKAAELLFEVYSDCNYEIIKTAYISGIKCQI